jgi:hypothetical protein
MAAPPIVERHLPHFHRRAPVKEACRAATTTNITIATALNNGDSLDGVTLATDDRVLVKDQSTGSQNGIYVVGAAPVRSYDLSTDDPSFGFLVYVREGTANARTLWENTNTTTPTIDTTALTFVAATAASIAASAVTVADAGGFFTGTNVETVLQELALKDIGYTAHGNTGSTETFDALTGWHSATLDAATVTATFTGATSGLVAAMVLELAQDGTGGRLVSWPGSVVWPGGVAPTLSTAAGAVDILTFFSRDGGTTWYGFMAGGSGSAIEVLDEGVSLTAALASLNFVGAGATATTSGDDVTVTIPGGATSSDTGAWVPVMDGSGSVVTDGYGQAVMTFVTF